MMSKAALVICIQALLLQAVFCNLPRQDQLEITSSHILNNIHDSPALYCNAAVTSSDEYLIMNSENRQQRCSKCQERKSLAYHGTIDGQHNLPNIGTREFDNTIGINEDVSDQMLPLDTFTRSARFALLIGVFGDSSFDYIAASYDGLGGVGCGCKKD